MQNLAGARVTQSKVVYTRPEQLATHEAFIIDFGRSCSVLAVEMTDGSNIVLLLPWLGTAFATRPAWPGGETPVPATTGAATVDLTGIETQKLFVQVNPASALDEAGFAAACRITTGTPPANLRASVGGRPPFWTYPGVLSEQVEITGLEAELNALAASGGGGVSLDISTDSPGVLTVSVDEVAVSSTAAASWAGKPSTSVELAALAPTVVPLPFPSDDRIDLRGVELSLSGTFPRWRAYTVGTDDAPGRLSMKVDARFGVARCVPIDSATSVYGVSLLLGPCAGGELHVELVRDIGGLPASGKPLALADVSVDASSEVAWFDVMLASPVDALAGPLWVVAKAKTGTIEWIGTTVPDADSGPATVAMVSSEGGRWESYPALGPVTPTTQVRVLRLPSPTDSTPLLSLAWPDGAGEAIEVNVGDDTTTVTLARPERAPLTIESREGTASVEIFATATSSGTLAIKGATAVF